MPSKVNVVIGHWIQPWPGESILGECIAVQDGLLICRSKSGAQFTVRMDDYGKWLDRGRARSMVMSKTYRAEAVS